MRMLESFWVYRRKALDDVWNSDKRAGECSGFTGARHSMMYEIQMRMLESVLGLQAQDTR
ncbi:hypothetical protein DPMN_069846 [Dreissena polymorpha]|uniref:Uncharacterized protein n=1 Tax=Dreissena polymorpha TaxID=45954 RepID=A0A9D3Z543_DREPO|nr:hypothetical protein DPMN_069846 [Dreissena polymorpha]